MKQQRDTGTGLSARTCVLVAAALLMYAAAGCDHDSSGVRFRLPTAPPSVPVVTEVREIEGVTSVSHQAVGVVGIEVGAAESLTITAPESQLPLLTSEVVGGELILDRSSNYRGQATDIRYDITLRQLEELTLHGVGEITADGVRGDVFSVTLRGVGSVRTSGRVDRQIVNVGSVGGYSGRDLESRVAEVMLTSGSAEIWATERIEGVVGFGCVLEYWGDPEIDVRALGTLYRRGPKRP